ncbi:hypothetical protein HCJ93_01590 [Streptomyces sp. SBST2-5]|uniref:Uncharacterized protein n=1 Tax=Streptomyces composti TaxID=2720025 RepID=A0ABX1A1B4_9ACTN|nr:hypothetical protein [Streptomyces composti]NJP48802.1 hypothetical protein [Streptomyces composti]
MTTFSSSPPSNDPAIPGDPVASPPADATSVASGTHRPDPPPGPAAATAVPPVATAADENATGPRDPVATVNLVDPLDPADPDDRLDLTDPDAERAARPAQCDPVADLVHVAVSDRPLEEVVDLITTLERSPEHSRSVIEALRAAGVVRSVEDVTRLVALLTRPPRDPDCADEAIRAAAAHRPVEDVTRLVALLHAEPLAAHCREEVLRAAATGRSVDELIDLIDRLEAEPLPRPPAPGPAVAHPAAPEPEAPRPERHRPRPRSAVRTAPPETRPSGRPRRGPRDGRRPRRTRPGRPFARYGRHPQGRARPAADPGRPPEPVFRSLVWSSWLAAAILALCAVAHFPLHHDGTSLRLHALAVGLSVLCTVLALILVVRPGVLVLVAAFAVPAVLAGAHVYGATLPSAVLSRAVDLALAPPWLASAAAVTAALLALAALVVRVASPFPPRRWTAAWPPPDPHHPAE